MFRRVTPGTESTLTSVDHTETYGRHILETVVPALPVSLCVDLGCGNGDDLMIVKKHHPDSKCIGIEFSIGGRERLTDSGIALLELNIENQPLPLGNETVDLVIANQVLEHTKEIYWLNHEIFRSLKVGGYLYLGVPNVLSLHNRILGLLGTHPTCAKMISAHVRVFSKKDTCLFYRELANEFSTVEGFYGSQFYPFPKMLSRPLARWMPSLAFSIFFLIRKTGKYNDQFIEWLSRVGLATNFFIGNKP